MSGIKPEMQKPRVMAFDEMHNHPDTPALLKRQQEVFDAMAAAEKESRGVMMPTLEAEDIVKSKIESHSDGAEKDLHPALQGIKADEDIQDAPSDQGLEDPDRTRHNRP